MEKILMMKLVCSYVRGGVDVSYEKALLKEHHAGWVCNKTYDFIEEFQEKFNDEISSRRYFEALF